jgi:hypothetical protein
MRTILERRIRVMIRTGNMLLLAAFITAGFLFFAATEEGYSGLPPMELTCCQLEGSCFDNSGDLPPMRCQIQDLREGEFCNEDLGLCSGLISDPNPNPIPTLSEWGLIAMAGILGIAGYIIVRRRKVSA